MIDWDDVRAEFPLTHDGIDFTAMVLASNPFPVRNAIRAHADRLDDSPFEYAKHNNPTLQIELFDVLERYFGISPRFAAFTQNTTVALAQIYGGIRLRPGQEMLTSRNEHFCTLEALRLRARRDGTPFRQVALYRDSATVTADEIVASLEAEIRPWTRVLALTWVSSADGVKLPVRRIADLVRRENDRRPPGPERLLLVIDGVHGFGVEDATFADLGCDLFAAGCHKWVFGPRGTAIMAGTEEAWTHVVPWVPSMTPPELGPARAHVFGGVRAYEHFWALAEAFRFLLRIGTTAIQQRVWELSLRLKQSLAGARGIAIRTPVAQEYSSGIVCLDVARRPAAEVVETLSKKYGIRTTLSVWDATAANTHVRLSVSILNDENQIDRAIEALLALGARHR